MESKQQSTLFDPRKGRHRTLDWVTSVEAAEKIAYKSGTQKHLLYEAFKDAYPNNLTDEEAALKSGLSMASEYSKRCGELRQDGVISVVWAQPNVPLTRAGASGVQRIVSILVINETK